MKTDIAATMRRHFHFLKTDYGMKLHAVPADAWDRKWTPAIAYVGDASGVLVQYDGRDTYLDINIFQMDNQRFPMRSGRISCIGAYPLNGSIFLSNPTDLIQPLPLASVDTNHIQAFEAYVENAAMKLRVYADDLLRGDFHRAPQIRAAIEQISSTR